MQKCARLLLISLASIAPVLAQETASRTPEASPPAVQASAPAIPNATPAEAPKAPPIELKPDASGTVPQEQIRELLRRVAEKDLENEKRLRDYTYIEREEEHSLDGHGDVKKVESTTSEVLVVYGEHVERRIAKDDKPLSADDARKEEERIQKIVDKRKNESEGDRRKRLEKEEKEREDGRKFVKEVADAYNFHLLGSETLDGHDTWMLDADPRSDYKPTSKESKFLPKLKGRIWIDKAEMQWVKFDIVTTDTISFGLFLARIHKGTRIVVETTRVNDEVWLPKHVQFHADIRLALVKNYDVDVEQTFRDYKKFRTESTFTVVGESQ
ncbi:MAG: hypothetical protein HY010_13340 [Acidobacteria bacterium]|nr:hypothetical protein [Acidobacteriota bacterium]